MSLVMGPPVANQIQGVFFNTRRVYEIRERPSRMYSWTALTHTAQILGELPLNITGSSLFFLVWYWLVGFPSSRAGVHLSDAWHHVTHVPHYIRTFCCRHVTEPCYRCAAVRLLLRLHCHLVSDAFIFSCIDIVSLLTTAMAYCNHTSTSAGGSGCTVLRLTPTSSKESLVKVRDSVL